MLNIHLIFATFFALQGFTEIDMFSDNLEDQDQVQDEEIRHNNQEVQEGIEEVCLAFSNNLEESEDVVQRLTKNKLVMERLLNRQKEYTQSTG